MKLLFAIVLISSSMIGMVHADQVLKEETTPPAAEGPLALNRIPPLFSAAKLNPAQAVQQPTVQTTIQQAPASPQATP